MLSSFLWILPAAMAADAFCHGFLLREHVPGDIVGLCSRINARFNAREHATGPLGAHCIHGSLRLGHSGPKPGPNASHVLAFGADFTPYADFNLRVQDAHSYGLYHDQSNRYNAGDVYPWDTTFNITLARAVSI